MTEETDAFGEGVRRCFERRVNHGMPPGVDVWPRVERRLSTRRASVSLRRRPHRMVEALGRATLVGAMSLAVAGGGLGIAAAASPAIRHALQLSGAFPGFSGQAADTDGRPLAIYPAPSFRVFFPPTVPSDMPVHAIGHYLGGALANGPESGPRSGVSLNISCPKSPTWQECVSQANQTRPHLLDLFPGLGDGPPGLPSLVAPLAQRHVDAVWFGFHALLPQQSRIEIVEWDAKASPIPNPSNITLDGQPAVLDVQQGQSTVMMVKDGTAIDVQSTLGPAATEDFVGSLQAVSVVGH